MNFANKLFDMTTLKFILVGIVNTIVGTAVMFLLFNVAGLHKLGDVGYWISTASNYVIGSIVSFLLNKYFTFNNKTRSLKQIIIFIINITICYGIAYGLAKPLTVYVLSGVSGQLQANIAMVVGMCFFVGLNYIGQRFIVFRADGEKVKKINE